MTPEPLNVLELVLIPVVLLLTYLGRFYALEAGLCDTLKECLLSW
jgi:hypothetical protein